MDDRGFFRAPREMSGWQGTKASRCYLITLCRVEVGWRESRRERSADSARSGAFSARFSSCRVGGPIGSGSCSSGEWKIFNLGRCEGMEWRLIL